MNKTLSYRLFKIGRIPKKLRPALEKEGIVACDEGIAGRVSLKNYSAPGKRSKYRMIWFSGFLAVTKTRLIAFSYWKPLINVPFGNPRIHSIHIELDGPNRLALSFDASAFRPDASGEILVRFKTPKAQELLAAIEKNIADATQSADAE